MGHLGARFFLENAKNRLISNFGGIIKVAGVRLFFWPSAAAILSDGVPDSIATAAN
jgi:hypothetical protein